jgi:hypothetical protein
MLLFSTINIVRAVRDPEAVRFFGVSLLVLSVVGALGSAAALILVGVRRLLHGGTSPNELSLRR